MYYFSLYVPPRFAVLVSSPHPISPYIYIYIYTYVCVYMYIYMKPSVNLVHRSKLSTKIIARHEGSRIFLPSDLSAEEPAVRMPDNRCIIDAHARPLRLGVQRKRRSDYSSGNRWPLWQPLLYRTHYTASERKNRRGDYHEHIRVQRCRSL